MAGPSVELGSAMHGKTGMQEAAGRARGVVAVGRWRSGEKRECGRSGSWPSSGPGHDNKLHRQEACFFDPSMDVQRGSTKPVMLSNRRMLKVSLAVHTKPARPRSFNCLHIPNSSAWAPHSRPTLGSMEPGVRSGRSCESTHYVTAHCQFKDEGRARGVQLQPKP